MFWKHPHFWRVAAPLRLFALGAGCLLAAFGITARVSWFDHTPIRRSFSFAPGRETRVRFRLPESRRYCISVDFARRLPFEEEQRRLSHLPPIELTLTGAGQRPLVLKRAHGLGSSDRE